MASSSISSLQGTFSLCESAPFSPTFDKSQFAAVEKRQHNEQQIETIKAQNARLREETEQLSVAKKDAERTFLKAFQIPCLFVTSGWFRSRKGR